MSKRDCNYFSLRLNKISLSNNTLLLVILSVNVKFMNNAALLHYTVRTFIVFEIRRISIERSSVTIHIWFTDE